MDFFEQAISVEGLERTLQTDYILKVIHSNNYERNMNTIKQ